MVVPTAVGVKLLEVMMRYY